MQAIYEYTGIVETVCELQTFSSGFTKRDLVLTDDNDVQTKYPNHIAFTFKKDNTAKLDKVQKGQGWTSANRGDRTGTWHIKNNSIACIVRQRTCERGDPRQGVCLCGPPGG